VIGRAGSGVDDRLMVRVGEQSDRPDTLSADGESFTFAGHAFIRVSGDAVTVRGDVREMAIRVGDTRPKLRVNGVPAEPRIADGFLYWKTK
jgi:hypothetical protein